MTVLIYAKRLKAKPGHYHLMTNQMSSAQTAQQNNRTNDGKYTTKSHSEAGVNIGPSAVTSQPIEQLYVNLSASKIETIEIISNDDGTYYLSHATPDTPEDFDTALDHVVESHLSWDDLCAEDSGWVEGQSTITLNVDGKIGQINRKAFRKLANTPTEDDMNQGYAAAFQQMMAEHHPVLQSGGRDDRKLSNTVDGHQRYRTIKDRATAEATRSAAYGRAYEQGIAIDPVDESNFEKMWSGELKEHPDQPDPKYGKSQQDIESASETCRKDYQWVEEGQLSPEELMGRGTSKQEALDAIQLEIDRYERGLATRGRSLEVNVATMKEMR